MIFRVFREVRAVSWRKRPLVPFYQKKIPTCVASERLTSRKIIVDEPEYYVYSSARDYVLDKKG